MSTKHILDELAAIIERDDNYRVLRRIVPLRTLPDILTDNVGKIVLVDTETTGTDAMACEMTELALLPLFFDKDTHAVMGVGEAYQSFNETIKPIPPETVELNGITDADVFGQAIDQDFVKETLAGAECVVAHNAAFDRPVLERHVPALMTLPMPWACSMVEIPWKKMGASSLSLGGIASGLGLFFDAHRALSDLHALAHLLSLPMQTAVGDTSILDHLIFSMRTPMCRVWADGSPYEVKDTLKARGYKYRSGNKTWYRDVSDGEDERQWLLDNRFSKSPRIVPLPATERYKNG